ncbi:methyltransferase domain-containing protein [Streptomyces sp. NPDC094032]|uniref:class I SAM-dependent methyltransferase n=1 Tax=Streptomyces sp. NPDC094032 TaxID=3155308 RepID=UPI003319E3CA
MYASTPDDWHAANRARWDERVPIHAASDYYGLDAFRAGKDALRDFELAEVGDVTGRSLLHLQCHIGLDTLSWARHGASRVVGLDFSEPAVETARSLAADLGLTPEQAVFVAADAYDAAEAVPDSSYDIVYTGVGALCWLPDLERWAETAASLVAPGGFLYVSEFHPIVDSFDDETGTRLVHDYFVRDPWVDTSSGTYADLDAATVHNRSVEWVHPVGEVVTALAKAGLRIEFLHEHDVTLIPRFESLAQHEDGYYRFAADRPRIPLMYSIKASKAPKAS